MVEDVPFDYVQSVLLGVTKELLVGTWILGKPHNSPSRIFNIMNSSIKSIVFDVLYDFPRKP